MFEQLQTTFSYDHTIQIDVEKLKEGVDNLARVRFLFLNNYEYSLGQSTIWPGIFHSDSLAEGASAEDSNPLDEEDSTSERKRKLCAYEEDEGQSYTSSSVNMNLGGSYTPGQDDVERGIIYMVL